MRVKEHLQHKAPYANMFDQKTSLEKEGGLATEKHLKDHLFLTGQRDKAAPFTLTCLGGATLSAALD